MEGSKSPFQALEPRAGAQSHQGGPRVGHAGSLDGRVTWARCGLAAITNKLFYGRVGGQGLPDSYFPCSPSLDGLRGSWCACTREACVWTQPWHTPGPVPLWVPRW